MQRQTAQKIERARLRAEREKKQKERRAAYLRAKAQQDKREKQPQPQLLSAAYATRLADAREMLAAGHDKADVIEKHGRIIYDHASQPLVRNRHTNRNAI